MKEEREWSEGETDRQRDGEEGIKRERKKSRIERLRVR